MSQASKSGHGDRVTRLYTRVQTNEVAIKKLIASDLGVPIEESRQFEIAFFAIHLAMITYFMASKDKSTEAVNEVIKELVSRQFQDSAGTVTFPEMSRIFSVRRSDYMNLVKDVVSQPNSTLPLLALGKYFAENAIGKSSLQLDFQACTGTLKSMVVGNLRYNE